MKKRAILTFIVMLHLPAFSLLPVRPASVSAFQSAEAKTLVLYDSASGAVPSSPLMGFAAFPTRGAVPIFEGGVTVLDTTVEGTDTFAGWVSNSSASDEFPRLDPDTGFHVDFAVQVESESHTNNNRAGYSVILLGDDLRGIELGFWQDSIWAQNDPPTGGLFKRGESTAFDTTADLVNYRLNIIGDSYTLIADGTSILSGPLRDYTSFEGFPDPYETPNFLFIGDDTTSAQARIRLGSVSITGTGPAAPAATDTAPSTTTSTPPLTNTPIPTVTQIPTPTPTPAASGSELCPSGWIFLGPLLAVPLLRRRT